MEERPCSPACGLIRDRTTTTGGRVAAAAVPAVAIAENTAVIILVTIGTGGGVCASRRRGQLELQFVFLLLPPLLLFVFVGFVPFSGLTREYVSPQIGGGVEEAVQSTDREAELHHPCTSAHKTDTPSGLLNRRRGSVPAGRTAAVIMTAASGAYTANTAAA